MTHARSAWADVEAELDQWPAGTATLWWRDDDAAAPTPALDRLLSCSAQFEVPLALAVIPAAASDALATRLRGEPRAVVFQHGYAHVNHAVQAKRTELSANRNPAAVAAELSAGAARLRDLFGGQALPVLVPPWNRIAAGLIERLPGIGFTGLSLYGPRPVAEPAPGLRQVNTHVDPIDWRGSRGALDEPAVLGALAGHLRARRTGTIDPDEATGLLTHHGDADAAGWALLERLLRRTARHRAVRWLDPRLLFPAR